MGMIMHDDVPYGAGTSYTQGTGIAINNNIIAVDADNAPTENSEKPVKSKGVYEVVEQIYADNGVLGAKNLLPNNATSKTINGVTFTVNDDGSVTVNGTATANTFFVIYPNTATNKYENNIISGCPTGGDANNSYSLTVRVGLQSDDTYVRSVDDIGNGKVVPEVNTSTEWIRIYIRIASGYTANNLTFYPMIRLASDPDDTYVPYAMTNREITEELAVQESAVTDIIEGATVNDNHLYKYGKVVQLVLAITGITATANDSIIAKIPVGFRPKSVTDLTVSSNKHIFISPSGNVIARQNMSNDNFRGAGTWITD